MANKFFVERMKQEEEKAKSDKTEKERLSMTTGLESLCKYIGLDKQIITAVEVVTVDEILQYFKELAKKQ